MSGDERDFRDGSDPAVRAEWDKKNADAKAFFATLVSKMVGRTIVKMELKCGSDYTTEMVITLDDGATYVIDSVWGPDQSNFSVNGHDSSYIGG